MACYEHVTRLQPESADGFGNLGNAYKDSAQQEQVKGLAPVLAECSSRELGLELKSSGVCLVVLVPSGAYESMRRANATCVASLFVTWRCICSLSSLWFVASIARV